MVSLRWLYYYNAPFSAKRHAENAPARPGATGVLRTASLVLYALALTGVVVWKAVEIDASYHSAGKSVTIQLQRGRFTFLEFPAKTPETRAILVFGSGDGGWSGFEEEISLSLQGRGYEVLGIDFNSYAVTDYDLATLQADFGKIARTAEQPYGGHPPPLIVGGWSMGAAQAIAVAGGPHPPRGLAGLLLLDPCSRGRYGLRLSDRADILPSGNGTFGVEEFARTLGRVRVVQWHAAEDSIDSRAWLASLTAPHKEFDFAKTGHFYSVGREDFLEQLAASVPWILSADRVRLTATGSKP
jgi:phosphatidylglycerol lysyltransferase